MTTFAACANTARFSGYLFTGKERDTESGNDYFGARYYASSMGRFMSPDPSQLYYADPTNPQSLNLYSYALNNPLKNTDPTGLYCDYGDGSAEDNMDPSQFDYHSSQSECETADENGNKGTWIKDAETHQDENGDWVDNEGRPDNYAMEIMVDSAPQGQPVTTDQYGVTQFHLDPYFNYSSPDFLNRPTTTIGPIPHTPPPPPPSAFQCAVTPTEAMAYHAVAMQIWRQQNGMNLTSSTPSDDDTGGAGGQSMMLNTSRGWRPFGSAGADAKFNAGAAAVDFGVAYLGCRNTK
jgi:RHS repeat-associated protein